MPKITEIIPDTIPDWAKDAMDDGQFFRLCFERIAELEQSLMEAADDIKTISVELHAYATADAMEYAEQYLAKAHELRKIAGESNDRE